MTNKVLNSEVFLTESADITGDQLINQFERAETPATSLHHADHVRLAFEYVRRFPPLVGLEKFSSALQCYAAARGKVGLYHETITWAYLFMIRERMARSNLVQNWEEFASKNSDLLRWNDGILDRLYNKNTLDSPLARSIFVLPDRGL